MNDAQDRDTEVPLRQQLREVMAVVWDLVKRRPVLLLWPVVLYLRFFERDTLDKWVAEAEGSGNG